MNCQGNRQHPEMTGRPRPATHRYAGVSSARLTAAWVALLMALLLGGLLGCGEKIAIPEAIGLFGVTSYNIEDTYPEPAPVQILIAKGFLFVLSGQGVLYKRDQDYDLLGQTAGLVEPTALCADDTGELIFVWEQGTRQVSIFDARELDLLRSSPLPDVHRVTGMVACRAGIEAVGSARTFLYLSDPDSAVIHRYVYDDFSGFSSYGILTQRYRADGQEGAGLRFVHVAAGMARDGEDSLLVCDADSVRNWVIRYNAGPDTTDVTPDPLDQDPWRGLAVRFSDPTCAQEVAGDYTLGKAEECDQEWVRGPSSKPGEFTNPLGVTVDGQGRIYVADTGNNRIQIFESDGTYVTLFGDEELTARPISLGIVDTPKGSQFYGAYVFVVLPDSQQVRKFISTEQREYERHTEPDE